MTRPTTYLPDHFRVSDALAVEAMQRYPFASVICPNPPGMPMISHIPLAVKRIPETSPPGIILIGHVARSNAQWQALAEGRRALVSFQGPSAYQSPGVYADALHVPTWNTITVDAEVDVQTVDDPHHKDALLKRLIAQHELPYAKVWRGLPEDYTETMLAHIVGLRMTVTALHPRFKLNQHRPESHAALLAAYEAGTPAEQELAGWMRRLGMGQGGA